MTTRVKGLIVVLEDDIREDDIEPLKDAIRHFGLVIDVINVDSKVDDSIIKSRIKNEIANEFYIFAKKALH